MIPVVVTVYNRPEHLRRALVSLAACDGANEAIIYVFSDAPAVPEHADKVIAARDVCKERWDFRGLELVARERNWGAKHSTLSAIEETLRAHGRIAFLEDDIVVSRHFLRYMTEGLARFERRKDILSICSYRLPFSMPKSYSKDIFLGSRYSPWGVGLWRDRWEQIDMSHWDRFSAVAQSRKLQRECAAIGDDFLGILEADSVGKIEAIDARICFHQIANGMKCVFPSLSLSTNEGFDGSGMHCPPTTRFAASLDNRDRYSIDMPIDIKESPAIRRRFRDFQNDSDGLVADGIRLAKRAMRKLLGTM